MSKNRIAAVASAIITMPAFCVLAQDYPVRPIRFLVTNAPGGGTDLMARSIGQKLNEAWGQPVIVDNRGGNATIPGELVMKAPPDGHTLLFYSSTIWLCKIADHHKFQSPVPELVQSIESFRKGSDGAYLN